ncbi:MarR family transcriptional regulator [Frankia sp. CNm7]|uniref:MarR family transcriptional regulator n=1 Tax=Frankia nepalensis TaxID=1836974 RepID=A0A937RGD2_9ACTN|nr:MarR family winged helix-turn-helix transcriptional regulator [Frankia nepalensis]MBL7498656.1 MarR family transcriptional regulator [Frankia nepalensis]MBL7509178.1 MarR family transcriptional regulator [Frankia nepalensis]MBL7519119.1 MarR family transcriptional regulator [Frankia nepalensis]MBL7628369.1 MarR family transcriptional regulator [Frankia nepalensis]
MSSSRPNRLSPGPDAPSPEAQLAPDDLANRLAEVYLVVGPLYRKVLRVVERSQPAMGMSVGVRAVLDQLRRRGTLTVPQLARDQDLSRQFVQRMVNDARAAGWVETVDNPAHRRSHHVRLTPTGGQAIGAVAAREHDLLRQVAGTITGADVDATLRVLTAMLDALDDRDRDGDRDGDADRGGSSRDRSDD